MLHFLRISAVPTLLLVQLTAPSLGESLDWESMDVGAFAEKLSELKAADSYLLSTERSRIGRSAAGLLAKNPRQIHALGKSIIEAAIPYALTIPRDSLRSVYKDWDGSNLGLEGLRLHVGLMRAARLEEVEVAAVVNRWLSSRSFEAYSQIDQAWLLNAAAGPQARSDSVQAEWDARLTIPTTGEYQFSSPPFRLNRATSTIRQRFKVLLDGEVVLSSGSDEGDAPVFVSRQLKLRAGDNIRLKVEFHSERKSRESPVNETKVARLLWEGPGIPLSVIPSRFLRPIHSNRESGVTASYQPVLDPDAPVRVEPSVDFVWYTGASLAPRYDVDRMADAVIAAAYAAVERVATGDSQASATALFTHPSWVLEFASPDQKLALLDALLAEDRLFSRLDATQVLSLYEALKFYAADKSLAIIGKWAQHPSRSESVFAADFTDGNRLPYWQLAQPIAQEYPVHASQLTELYLKRGDDGGCCLPVAYILAFIHHHQQDPQKWIREVDAFRSVGGLSGDAAAEWLIARAMAEELALLSHSPFRLARVSPLVGQQWLQEAYLVAESSEMKVRVAREFSIRYAGMGLFDLARKQAEQARGSEASRVASDWNAEISVLENLSAAKLRRRKKLLAEFYK